MNQRNLLLILGLSIFIVAKTGLGAQFRFKQNDQQMDMGYITKWVNFEDKAELCLIDTGARKSVVRSLF